MDNLGGTQRAGSSMGHEEVYNLLVSNELSWQQMIYDLIKSEQLDPWNVDIVKLTSSYLEKIKEMEEANFVISSKILLAAALLLRIKSEYLINYYIRSLDEILFGKPEKKEAPPLEINLDDVSDLFPRTPLPRPKRVTLDELIQALNRAMVTEHRRIKKEVNVRHALNRFQFFLPKNRTDVRIKIKDLYGRIKSFFGRGNKERMTFTELSPTKEEKKISFGPMLHLDNQERILLNQLNHFDEIYIYLKDASGSAEDVVKELEKRQEAYEEEKIKEQIEDDMRNKFEQLSPPENIDEEVSVKNIEEGEDNITSVS